MVRRTGFGLATCVGVVLLAGSAERACRAEPGAEAPPSVSDAVTKDQSSPPTVEALPPAEAKARLETATRHLVRAEYDEATAVLESVVAGAQNDPETLREAYLLLIKTYVIRGNYHRQDAQGRVTSELYYRKADDLILECLNRKALRDTKPTPPSDYPPEMLTAFERVRSANFGAFRVASLDPPGALVILDGEALRPAGDPGTREVAALPTGPHEVEVRAEGYEGRAETIEISGGSTLVREYRLERGKDVWWWVKRVGLAAAIGTASAVASSSGGSEGPQPLPGPPDPPE